MFFKDVIGHIELKSKLIQDVREDKVPHALLFLGNLGFGNLPLVLAFVQYLMCENKGIEDSCGECSSCKNIQKLEHPDVHFSFPTVQTVSQTSDPLFRLWKESILENPKLNLKQWTDISDNKGRKPVISVHQSAEILRKLNLKSFGGGYRVSIIWKAEEMNVTCSNKLLKIIEEPPVKTIFILVAESEENILATILSRTQLVKIKPLKHQELSDYLSSKYAIEQDLAESLASRTDGDLAVAETLLKESGEENINFQWFVDLMRSSYKKDVLGMLNWAEQMAKLGKEEQKHFILYALYMLRQSIIKNYVGEQLNQTSKKEDDFLKNFSRFITNNNIMDFKKLFDSAYYNLERNAHSKLLFTNITFEVMRYIHRAQQN